MGIIIALIAAAVVVFVCATVIAVTRRICESKERNTSLVCCAVIDALRKSGETNKMN